MKNQYKILFLILLLSSCTKEDCIYSFLEEEIEPPTCETSSFYGLNTTNGPSGTQGSFTFSRNITDGSPINEASITNTVDRLQPSTNSTYNTNNAVYSFFTEDNNQLSHINTINNDVSTFNITPNPNSVDGSFLGYGGLEYVKGQDQYYLFEVENISVGATTNQTTTTKLKLMTVNPNTGALSPVILSGGDDASHILNRQTETNFNGTAFYQDNITATSDSLNMLYGLAGIYLFEINLTTQNVIIHKLENIPDTGQNPSSSYFGVAHKGENELLALNRGSGIMDVTQINITENAVNPTTLLANVENVNSEFYSMAYDACSNQYHIFSINDFSMPTSYHTIYDLNDFTETRTTMTFYRFGIEAIKN